jgi:hypothetical protein
MMNDKWIDLQLGTAVSSWAGGIPTQLTFPNPKTVLAGWAQDFKSNLNLESSDDNWTILEVFYF